MRISKYTAKCLRCGTELTVYPRHIEHKEPIVCPGCGRRNSADEFDFSDQMAAQRKDLEALFRKKG
jgi:DNA-directed RNA polymerase subunit RPC12/RpoP